MTPSKLDAAAALESMDSMDALQSKPLTMIPDEIRPAFDYSGLDAQTVDDLHFAEKEYQHGKKLAERGLVHMGNAIAAAHDALCGTVVQQLDNGQFAKKDDTFRAWCCSIGITKSTAYNLLQVSALMDGSSPRQQKILKELSPTLLYAVAKPSAPAELVEQVKSGDITTNKQYQEALAQLKAEKERANTAEAREEEARKAAHEYHEKYEEAAAMRATLLDQQGAYIADVNGLMEQNAQLKKQTDAAEARAKDAENQLAGSRQVAQAAKLRGDKLKAENDALKHQPITAVVDEEEVDRRAGEKAYRMAADMTAELQAKLDATAGDAEQDARNAYDGILLANRAIINTWQIARPLFRKLPEEQREALANQIARTVGNIQGEVTKCL